MTIEKIDIVSVKRVCGAFKKPEAGTSLALLTVIGVVLAVKTRTTDAGETTRFVGDFIARNEQTGALFQADSLILPTFAADMLSDAGAGGDAAVSFSLNVSASTDAKGRPQFKAAFGVEPSQAQLAGALVKEHAPGWLTDAAPTQAAPADAGKSKGKGK